ncbi:tautomerase family protein [Pseudoduganella sp. UC29_106]|uniref:tautomerase family protein n=1 Tax=Pseudoduganella sp. UC29_106 TaxID=3374553 RepID=UPI00375632D6
MPLVRISLNSSAADVRRRIGDAVHQAMVDTIDIPTGDRFQIITSHAPGEIIYDANFYGIDRTEGFIAIQITLAAGRRDEVKTKLYARIAELLNEAANVRPEDVFISLLEVGPADFSLGNGKAQFLEELPPHLKALQKQAE